ncbi:tyrosine-protein phosphatase non-receptor type 1-like [Saccostrea cucullata]|uniref:tyrosine-protein phosphatase non-receptor type 1-like n=1 Tax=Saccostrea cuccullata TaxID=36930 RepID=UPI002ED31983
MEENAEIEYIVTDNDQKKTLIKIADLGNIIKIFSMEENKKFTEEFKGIPYGEQQHIPCSVAKLQQNMPKNRYKTTFPYDHSRVVLNVSPDNDYINANYIKDVEGKRRYIATQGNSFWLK